MVLDPFNSPPVKGPSEFGVNTSISEKKSIYNIAPNIAPDLYPGEMWISFYP